MNGEVSNPGVGVDIIVLTIRHTTAPKNSPVDLKENTTIHHYIDQLVNALWGNNSCLL
jgi:hypothetical protein